MDTVKDLLELALESGQRRCRSSIRRAMWLGVVVCCVVGGSLVSLASLLPWLLAP